MTGTARNIDRPLAWKPKTNDQAWQAPGDGEIRKTVWTDLGTSINVLSPNGRTRGDRGKNVDLVGQVEVETLTDNLKRQQSGIVGTVGFYVAPKK